VKKVEDKGDDKKHRMAEEAANRGKLFAPLTWAQRLKRVFNMTGRLRLPYARFVALAI
jgi:hypothetical protein